MPPITLFRYIAGKMIVSIGGLFLILASLILLVELVENLRLVGKIENADFGFALRLTLLRTPALSQSLMPFVFLFGSLWMFNQLNRRSELSVMRSAGLSVWRLIGPAAFIAAISGLLVIVFIDPLAARMYSYAEQSKNEARGKSSSLVRVFGDGIWLRQRDDGSTLLINARTFDSDNAILNDVTVWRLGPEMMLEERIDSAEAHFLGRTFELREARLKGPNDQFDRRTPTYSVTTALTPADLRERVPAPETMSVWDLPRFILLAEAAGLPTLRYDMRFHDLTSTPLKLLSMVLIAALFSLKPVRSGGTLNLLVYAVIAGFVLYILSEVSSAMGLSGAVPTALAAWTPALIATIVAITAILQVEDG